MILCSNLRCNWSLGNALRCIKYTKQVYLDCNKSLSPQELLTIIFYPFKTQTSHRDWYIGEASFVAMSFSDFTFQKARINTCSEHVGLLPEDALYLYFSLDLWVIVTQCLSVQIIIIQLFCSQSRFPPKTKLAVYSVYNRFHSLNKMAFNESF